jgi:hypothetical protein
MPDPQATFSIFAEVSVALAGFSGIVIAFGHRTLGGLTRLEIRRLSNLFILSGTALFVSLVGISLLHLELADPGLLWRIGSAVIFVLATPWLIWDVVRVRRLEKAERAGVNPFVLFTFNSLAVVMLLLQVANWFSIASPWPLFLGIVLTIAGAFQQFILLVGMSIKEEDGKIGSAK